MKGVITICGSTKYRREFEAVNAVLTLKGFFVLTVGSFGHDIKNPELKEVIFSNKEHLDKLHKEKIDLSFAIFVIDADNYIGSSTKSEINHADQTGKKEFRLSHELSNTWATLFDDIDRALYVRFMR